MTSREKAASLTKRPST